MPEMFTYPTPQFHYELASIFINREQHEKSCIVAPRGHAKSSVVGGVFPLYHLLMEDPGKPKFILFLAKTADHAGRLLQTVTDTLEYSRNLRTMFGYWGKFSAKLWRYDRVILKDGSIMMAKGTGQMVIGLKHLHQRPTLIIVDDPEDLENTRTDEAMEKNLEWLLRQVVPTRDPARGRVMVIGTPQHQRCIVETLAKSSDWSSKRYSALNDDDTRPLWGDGPWTLERLLREKKAFTEMGRLSFFMREYQCVVTSDEQDRLHEPKFYRGRHLEEYGENYMEIIGENERVEKIPVNIFLGIDPATSTSARADYTAIVPIAMDRNKNVYVLPYIRRRMRPSETIAEIIRLNRLYRPRGNALEATQAQETFRDILRTYEGERIPGLSRKIMPRDRKEKRYLDILEPLLAMGKIFIKADMHDMLNEIRSYGPLSQHDDLLDGLYYAVKYAHVPHHEPVDGIRRHAPQYEKSEGWALS